VICRAARRVGPLLLATAVAAHVHGQSAGGAFRAAPQYLAYTLNSGRIDQLAVPVAYVYTFSERFSADLASAYARVTVRADDGSTSTLRGLTDTQVRANFTLPDHGLLLTAGLNVPTGRYRVADAEIAAATRIGNDFLAFPVSSFGSGWAATGGAAYAHSIGAWNIGVGASFRQSAEFRAYATDDVRFQPANEVRLRLGVDRRIGEGRLLLASIYSRFGEDRTRNGSNAASTYSNGDRYIGQGALEVPLAGVTLSTSGWLLYHRPGETVLGAIPGELVANLFIAAAFDRAGWFIEPSVEMRRWEVDGARTGAVVFVGVRTRFSLGPAQVSPSVSYGSGALYGDLASPLRGVRGGVTLRVGN
jgi:hypothetical protein